MKWFIYFFLIFKQKWLISIRFASILNSLLGKGPLGGSPCLMCTSLSSHHTYRQKNPQISGLQLKKKFARFFNLFVKTSLYINLPVTYAYIHTPPFSAIIIQHHDRPYRGSLNKEKQASQSEYKVSLWKQDIHTPSSKKQNSIKIYEKYNLSQGNVSQPSWGGGGVTDPFEFDES